VAPTDDHTSDPTTPCGECGEPLAADQRYCLKCGERRAPVHAAVAARFAASPPQARKPLPGDGVAAAVTAPLMPTWMPSPRAAALAILAMLGLGVLLGSAGQELAQSAGVATILVESPPPAAPEEPAESQAEPKASAEAPATAPVPLATPAALPLEEPAPQPEPEPALPPEIPEEPGLPDVRHVFVIMLGENGFEEAFGDAAPAPYLADELASEGELLPNYYAVSGGSLANQIALLSGQGPTPETVANCPTYAELSPGTVSVEGQAEGSGCVYPPETPTLPGQLAGAGKTWRAYVEDIGNGVAAGQAASCRHPALGEADPSPLPLAGDAYVTWRNPFVYFRSLTDSPECAENDVGLDRLAADLKSAKKTPTLSYIAPNACHDGGEAPCLPDQPAGPLEAEAFLRDVVPMIQKSKAYADGGLIAITSTQAPQTGPHADSSSCCVSPAYPNLPAPVEEAPASGPVKASGGGGRVGMLLISPFVEAGSVNEATYANHYSLLLTIEELFGLEKLGYANELALTAFDSSVFNAPAETGSAGGQAASRSSSATSASTRAAISSRVARTVSSDWPFGSGRSQSR